MIWESYYWKEELRRHAKSLRHRSTKQKRWVQASFGRVEQHAMIGCFMVRRLIEAEIVSTLLSKKPIHLQGYPFDAERLPDIMNWHHIERHYDVKTKRSVTLPVIELCNQIMHSYIFTPVLDEETNSLQSLLFTSDRKRGALLFEIEALRLAELFEEFADNYPVGSHSIRDEDGQWVNYHVDASEKQGDVKATPEQLKALERRMESLINTKED